MTIEYTAKFSRSYRKLPGKIKEAAEKCEVIFRKNPYDHRLKTHRLKGGLKSLSSFSITYKHRILFELISKKTALFHDVGDHNVYR